MGRVLARAGLSHLKNLDPAEPIQHYEHAAPGDLLHIDTKKLGRIVRPSHRVTGQRWDSVEGAGWEMLFVAIDDHARIGFTDMYPDETKTSAVQFLCNAVAYYQSLGVTIKRLLTDNGAPFRARDFASTCAELNIRHRFTRPYRPQTSGKAERFIQSALREWAYGFVYQSSLQRTQTLDHWIHHYNWHRPHQGIGGVAPMTRLNSSKKQPLDTSHLAGVPSFAASRPAATPLRPPWPICHPASIAAMRLLPPPEIPPPACSCPFSAAPGFGWP